MRRFDISWSFLRRKVQGRVRLTNSDRWFLIQLVSMVSVAGRHDRRA